MTNKDLKDGILPEYDYELRFDEEEVGAAACTHFGLVTDYGSPADILVRFPTVGFGRHVDGAREKAEALAKEIVRRWNTETAIKDKAAFHKDDRYLTTDDGQVFDRNNNRFVPDDELEAINTYEKVSTPAIADGVGVEPNAAITAFEIDDNGRRRITLFVPDDYRAVIGAMVHISTPPQAATDEG